MVSSNAAAAAAQEPTSFTIFALILGGVALVAALLALFQGSKKIDANTLHTTIDAIKSDAASKSVRQTDYDIMKRGFEDRIARLEKQVQALEAAGKTAVRPQPPAAGAGGGMFSFPLPKPKPLTDEELCRDFLDGYNEARKKNQALAGTLDAAEQRAAFQQKYGLHGISCTNYNARMKNPALPAVFAEQKFETAKFWAYPIPDQSGRYAVVPSFHDYTAELHQQAGGNDLFQSNYTSGACKNVRVVRPALFSTLTTFETKGELELS